MRNVFYNNIKVKLHLFFLILFTASLLVNNVSEAQAISRTREVINKKKKFRHIADSSWKKDVYITDTSAALLINRIEQINKTLNAFSEILESGYDTSDISEEMPRYQRNLDLIKYNISSLSGSLNLRNLSLIQDMLGDINTDLKDWQSSLLSYYTELVSINTQMRTISVDSSLQDLPSDSALRFLYLRQMNELKTKWLSTDTITKNTILRIDKLQSYVSNQYFESTELQGRINNLIKTYSKKVFDNELGYIWESPVPDTNRKGVTQLLNQSVQQSSKIFQYYLSDNWGGRIVAIILTILFFIWVLHNSRKIKTINNTILLQLKYVRPIPLLASVIFLFTIIPFFDLHPPVVFVELMELLLAGALTILLYRKWPKDLFIYWLIFFASLVFHSIIGSMVSNNYPIRITSFFTDLVSVFIGLLFLKKVKKYPAYFPGYFSVVTILYIFLNVAAVFCGFFGRGTLSQMFGNTAISNFLQAIGLIIFIQIFLDAIFLQLEADKKSSRFTAYLNYQNVELRLRYILTFIATIFWFVNLTQNLNIYEATYNFIQDFLDKEQKVGNTSFTLGSIAIFFVVIWFSNMLQKYIGYFFGDTDNDVMPEKKTKLGTSILLIRLLILTVGFFLAILASGIPLDRVTIIIGALGVGIGLGLQNIVNNLVSGVILAIERPIQVGDIIEISSNTGRVKEIGIRSTRIITPDGAEVIVPNGDMLSQKLINWTLSNSHARVELTLKLANGSDAGKVKELILPILANNKDIMPKPEPQVIIQNISQSGADLKLLFWADDINKLDQIKSDTLSSIYTGCNKENITII